MTETLKITDLHVSVEDKPILCGVNLTIRLGETHALMGPNGSGKSTLGNAIMGHPGYQVTKGSIELDGENVLEWDATERARELYTDGYDRVRAAYPEAAAEEETTIETATV